MAKIGKNILENLTTGMYSDSKVAYREYVQNACDQIDKAIDSGIVTPELAEVEKKPEPKHSLTEKMKFLQEQGKKQPEQKTPQHKKQNMEL